MRGYRGYTAIFLGGYTFLKSHLLGGQKKVPPKRWTIPSTRATTDPPPLVCWSSCTPPDPLGSRFLLVANKILLPAILAVRPSSNRTIPNRTVSWLQYHQPGYTLTWLPNFTTIYDRLTFEPVAARASKIYGSRMTSTRRLRGSSVSSAVKTAGWVSPMGLNRRSPDRRIAGFKHFDDSLGTHLG